MDLQIYSSSTPRVAILREQGSNGDREMAAAFFEVGFEPWDVTMSDLVESRVSLDQFSGVAFVGGFSHADTFGSGKGWAASIIYNETLQVLPSVSALLRADVALSGRVQPLSQPKRHLQSWRLQWMPARHAFRLVSHQ